jgi:hypothetical protein
MTLVRNGQHETTLQQMQSQHEASAFASMVVASLPFPPLPVLVLQGEDGEYGMASSFDLLQQAIVVQQLGCVPPGDLRDLVRGKKAILDNLTIDMTAHYEEAAGGLGKDSLCSSLWVQRAYDIYCAAFRSYLLRNYATCTHDLRFHALDSVPADSMLVRQGTSHWKAGRVLSGECELGTECELGADKPTTPAAISAASCFSSYTQMLRSYAVDLATLQEA